MNHRGRPTEISTFLQWERHTLSCQAMEGWKVNHRRPERIWRQLGVKAAIGGGGMVECVGMRTPAPGFTRAGAVWRKDSLPDARWRTSRERIAVRIGRRLTSGDVPDAHSDFSMDAACRSTPAGTTARNSLPAVCGSGWRSRESKRRKFPCSFPGRIPGTGEVVFPPSQADTDDHRGVAQIPQSRGRTARRDTRPRYQWSGRRSAGK